MANFEAAGALLIIGIIWFIYDASINLSKEQWQLKLALFYGALILGWAGLNFGVRIASEQASPGIQDALGIFYNAYTFIGILLIFWLGLWAIIYLFGLLKKLVNRKKEKEIVELEEDEQVW